MNKVEYDIVLNKEGRPCVELADYVNDGDNSNMNFLATEISVLLLIGYITKIKKSNIANKDEIIIELTASLTTLSELTDMSAKIIKNDMVTRGNIEKDINKYNIPNNIYDFSVFDEKELLSLPTDNEIIYNNMIFKREKGLKILNIDTNTIYELVGGIENKNWVLSK